MAQAPASEETTRKAVRERLAEILPRPSPSFRQSAWRRFQRELDPLAGPKPLPIQRQR